MFSSQFLCRSETNDFVSVETDQWPILFRPGSTKQRNGERGIEDGKEEGNEETVAENDGIRLLTASSTPKVTYSPRRKTQPAHGQPETDDGLLG